MSARATRRGGRDDRGSAKMTLEAVRSLRAGFDAAAMGGA
jgi:hypothetical protein